MTSFLRAIALLFPLLLSVPAVAGDVMVHDPWARASAGSARNGGAFMTLMNKGKTDDWLLSASSPAADKIELHTHIRDGEVMRMRAVESISVRAGDTTVLKPGGLHVMFFGLHAPLKEGDTFPLTLMFKNAGTKTISVAVKSAGAGAMDHSKMKHEKMDHGKMKH